MSDPIDGLIEWLDKAVEFHQMQLETDEEIKESNVLYLHYSGMLSGFQLARNRARHYKKHSAEVVSEEKPGSIHDRHGIPRGAVPLSETGDSR